MQPLHRLFVPLLVVLVALPSRALGDERHVTTPSAIAAAVAEHIARERANRTAIHEALANTEVRAFAARMGVNADHLDALSNTLSGSELEGIADQARAVNESLAGGASTITLSTTTIIIGLLLLILLIVALK